MPEITDDNFHLWEEARNKIQERVEEYIGRKPRVIYSAYPTDKNEIPVDNLDDFAAEGKIQLFEEGYDDSPDNAEDYYSPVLESPTWLEVCRYADEIINHMDYVERVYLESLQEKEVQDGIRIMEISFGS